MNRIANTFAHWYPMCTCSCLFVCSLGSIWSPSLRPSVRPFDCDHVAGMAGSCDGLLVFDLESWCAFQNAYLKVSKVEAVRLWASMADRSDVRCFEDVAGVVHLGFSSDTLQACCGVEMTHAFAPVTVVVASGADVALTETLTTGEEK